MPMLPPADPPPPPPPPDDPHVKPTVRMPQLTLGDKLTIEFSDPDKVAEFFDLCARLVREKRKITVMIE